MSKNDKELKQTFQICLDEDNSIISILFLTEETIAENIARQTELLEEVFMRILNEDSQKNYKVIVDILDLGKGAGDISPHRAKKAYGRMASQKQVKKIAVVLGGNIVLEVMANIVVRSATKGKPIRFFNNKKEAIAWLKKD